MRTWSKNAPTILAEYKAQGEALKASIIEKAKTQAAQITAQAKQTAEQETRYAIEGIRAELADLVVESAEKMLKDKLTKEEHEKLVEKILNKGGVQIDRERSCTQVRPGALRHRQRRRTQSARDLR